MHGLPIIKKKMMINYSVAIFFFGDKIAQN